MSEAAQMVRVVEVSSELGRYRVESWTGDDPHLVDIFAYQCNGECSCDYFQFNCRKHLTTRLTVKGKDFKPIPYRRQGNTQCRHIKAANMRAWWTIKRQLAAAQNEQGR